MKITPSAKMPDWPSKVRFEETAQELLTRPMLAENPVTPAWPLSLDWHPGLEVGVLLSGRQRRLHTDGEYFLEAGDVWLHPMWEPHAWSILDDGSRRTVIMFLPQFLGEEMLGPHPWLDLFTVPPGQRPRVVDEHVRALVLEVGNRLWEEVERRAPEWETAVRLHLLHLLFTISRSWTRPEPEETVDLHETALVRIMPVVTMLRSNPSQRLSLQSAAAFCNLSQTRFRAIFKDTMGVSFGKFCLRERAASAGHLLTSTNLGLHQVAERSGFADASHLHRTFMNYYGCTPTDYRRRFREPIR